MHLSLTTDLVQSLYQPLHPGRPMTHATPTPHPEQNSNPAITWRRTSPAIWEASPEEGVRLMLILRGPLDCEWSVLRLEGGAWDVCHRGPSSSIGLGQRAAERAYWDDPALTGAPLETLAAPAITPIPDLPLSKPDSSSEGEVQARGREIVWKGCPLPDSPMRIAEMREGELYVLLGVHPEGDQWLWMAGAGGTRDFKHKGTAATREEAQAAAEAAYRSDPSLHPAQVSSTPLPADSPLIKDGEMSTEDSIRKQAADELKKQRKAAGHTQQTAADAMGVTQRAWSRWESGGASLASLVPAFEVLGRRLVIGSEPVE